ncbi:MAG: hypothetical protein NkDv07_0278 [Candidatus Improbicoccus devescovinae]|nr:MAG: hypothetical protein NkDv07_0278 [Candidatus Improbicoccus devescovinae]
MRNKKMYQKVLSILFLVGISISQLSIGILASATPITQPGSTVDPHVQDEGRCTYGIYAAQPARTNLIRIGAGPVLPATGWVPQHDLTTPDQVYPGEDSFGFFREQHPDFFSPSQYVARVYMKLRFDRNDNAICPCWPVWGPLIGAPEIKRLIIASDEVALPIICWHKNPYGTPMFHLGNAYCAIDETVGNLIDAVKRAFYLTGGNGQYACGVAYFTCDPDADYSRQEVMHAVINRDAQLPPNNTRPCVFVGESEDAISIPSLG